MTVMYITAPFPADQNLIAKNYEMISNACAAFIAQADATVICPILQFVNVKRYLEQEKNEEFWDKQYKTLLRHCDALGVLQFDGWEEDAMVKREIEFAQLCGIPINYYKINIEPPAEEKPEENKETKTE